MLFTNITVLDEELKVRENCYVAVEEDRISYIGDSMPDEYNGRVYDG